MYIILFYSLLSNYHPLFGRYLKGYIYIASSKFYKTTDSSFGQPDWLISFALIFIWALLEPCRLYLGYGGNLREKIPNMFGFFLVCFLQLGLICYYGFGNPKYFPIDLATSSVMIVFLFSQLILR